MADWSAELPGTAAEGNPGHPEDHNKIVAAIREVRSNVDDIELTPGPPGDDGDDGHTPEITFNGTKIVVDGTEGPDLKGDPGKDGVDGEDGAPGAPSQEEWDALVARVEALEAGE